MSSDVVKMPKRSLLLHPISLFCSVWFVVASLYELRLSKLLIATDLQVTSAIALILAPFIVAVLLITVYSICAPRISISQSHLLSGIDDEADVAALKKRLNRWLVLWGIMSVIEIIASGGIPIIWLLTGSSKTYFDFGIKSVHGLLNSLLLAVGLCYTGLFARFGNRRDLRCFTGILVWAILTITRGMIIVNLLQSAIVIMLYRGISPKFAVKLVAIGLMFVFTFGVVGDFRTGGSTAFTDLAQPTAAYPEWLPSGDLWVYIYLTTPLNNLIYTVASLRPMDNALFPNTAASLFPSVLRNLIYGDDLSEAVSGELVDSAFNVSTAYVGPYEDYGKAGMALVSLFIGGLVTIYWRRTSLRDSIIYAVLAQCLIITVFGNNFFSLPVISQVFWIYLFFRKSKRITKVQQRITALVRQPGYSPQ